MVKQMTDIQRIITLYGLYGSYSRVAREMNVSRNTVRKYLRRKAEVQNGIRTEILPEHRTIKQPRRVVTNGVISIIHSLLVENQKRPNKQRMNAKLIHNRVVQSGHQISYSTTKRIMRDWNKDHAHREVYILQETPPGLRAEFDWADVNLQIADIWYKLSLAVMVLTGSLYRFARIFWRETHMEVISAHIEFFQEIQAVPNVIVYDNLKVVYDFTRGAFQDSFLRFSTHYGFEPQVCNKSSPHEKGTDEESVGYIRTQAFGVKSSFSSFEEAQNWLIETLSSLNSKHVYRREKIPVQGLIDEKEHMLPLPISEFSNYLIKTATISKYSLVRFEKNFYSVPDTWRPKNITLKISINRIELTDGNQIIATHSREFSTGKYVFDISHYLKTFERKPGALKYSKVLTQVHEKIVKVHQDYYLDRPLDFLHILGLIKETSLEGILYALDRLQELGIVPEYDTIKMILFQNLAPMIPPLEISDPVLVDEPDLSVYDRLTERA